MRVERALLFAAIAACVLPLIPWLFVFSSHLISDQSARWSEFGGYLGGILSPILAFTSFVGLLVTIREQKQVALIQKQQSDDLNYFGHASASLKRAYETLIHDSVGGRPNQNRLAWLTSARLLLSAADISRRISGHSAGLAALYRGEEEHWRQQFYELLHPRIGIGIGAQTSYFAVPSPTVAINLEERSIRVIFEFANWPEGKVDPIEAVSLYTEAELDAMNAGMSAVRQYVRTMPRFRTP